jgi:hypothetical protein
MSPVVPGGVRMYLQAVLRLLQAMVAAVVLDPGLLEVGGENAALTEPAKPSLATEESLGVAIDTAGAGRLAARLLVRVSAQEVRKGRRHGENSRIRLFHVSLCSSGPK